MNALIYLRVSSTKQSDKGESLEQQEEVCRKQADMRGYKVMQAFREPYSGRKDSRPALDAMFAYISSDPSISAVFIRDIDRLTRGGASSFSQFKKRLSEYGVSIIDCAGIIQEEKNTLEELGVEYSWSKKSPTRFAENFKADMAQEEVSTMLTRMIGQEIRLVRKGYALGPAQYGYQNEKIICEDGKKRPIRVPNPQEARFIREMFTLRAEGLSDEAIVNRMNALGYKSRRYNVRDKKTRKVVGNRGEKPLTVKQLQKYISHPVYAGIIVGKWTQNKPVKAQFKGLVSVDLFNKANRGKIFIKEKPLEIIEGQEKRQRIVNNPEYPFKRLVTCDCGNPLTASASRGKSGKRHHYYHCYKGHNFRVPREEFHETVGSFFEEIGVGSDTLDMLEMVAVDQFRIEQLKKVDDVVEVSNNVTNLRLRQQALLKEYTSTDSSLIKKMIAEQIENIEEEIKNATNIRNKTEVEEEEMRGYLNYVKKMFEHPYEFFLKPENKPVLEQYWDLVFREPPAYKKLHVRTPNLSLVAAVKHTVDSGQIGDGGQGGSSFEHYLNSLDNWLEELLFDVRRFYIYPLK
jgi:DNA invertase Pin-like site-specific DNA recombinase